MTFLEAMLKLSLYPIGFTLAAVVVVYAWPRRRSYADIRREHSEIS